ncbi:TonB-dependent receptor [Aestuariibaculum marinum]|uniref:TonB-dependent receptor n=1 Tax=Aestuariibaculum marinum TaxID=2683592 RepID=A0A8J6PUG9_9FLAO|nr:TonB-dependent receptor [Aestuariibaculum marinum]MBD0824000.1 TonB-dependent receptor [Aestuariibaculum marinum]
MKHLLFCMFFMSFLGLFAQEANIHGVITDENNQPISYAAITLKGLSKGAVSDDNGIYKIEHLEAGNYTLQFSGVGYIKTSRSVTLKNNESLEVHVSLQTDLGALNEVVITSNRVRETLDEVPSSVSVVTAQQMENLGQTSTTVADVLLEVPGIALSTNQTSNTGQTLRGRKMLVLIDGIPQSTPLRNGNRDINTIDPNTIERIEIIKGATAIYGNGADGGIVNYITKKTNAAKAFESTTVLGSTGALKNTDKTVGANISQTFSGNLDKLGYVVNGTFRQTGVFRDANGEVVSPYYGIGETDQYSLFGKLNYQIADNHKVEVMYNYFSSNQNSDYVAQVGEFGVTPSIGVLGEDLGADQGNRYNHNAQITYDFTNIFGDTDFKLNLYAQDFRTVYGFTTSFYDPDLGFDGGQSSIISTKMGARFNFNTPYELGEVTGNVLYGVDVLNDVTAQELVDGRPWVPETDMTNLAPYAQLKTLYDDFVFKAGIRFENIGINIPDYVTLIRYRVGETTPSSGGVAVEGGDLEYNATTFNVGLRYNKWSVFKPFVSFSQSFSIADLGRTLRSATESTVSQINSDAVIANNYEAGFNGRIGNTNFSGAYFISTSKFGATYSELPSGVFEIDRQPERVYGFEATADTKLTNNLGFGASVSYTEGKLDTENNGDYNTYMNSDRIPPLKTVAYLAYNWANKFNARLSYIYSGNRDHFEGNDSGDYAYGQGPISSFNLVNLTTSYQLTPSTKIGLGIENLLNEDYYNLLSQFAARDNDYIKANGARFNLALTVKL